MILISSHVIISCREAISRKFSDSFSRALPNPESYSKVAAIVAAIGQGSRRLSAVTDRQRAPIPFRVTISGTSLSRI